MQRGETIISPRRETDQRVDMRTPSTRLYCYAGRYLHESKNLIAHKSLRASAGCCTRFMNCNKLVLRQKTKICQRFSTDLEEKITSLQRSVIKERQSHSYPLSQIGNIYGTPTFCTGHEKTHFTTVFACMSDGTKLPPMVIFKRKTMPKDKFPEGVSFMCTRKAGYPGH